MTEERRLVTVVFADVVGSTALNEQLDPEDIRAQLAAYYTIAKEVIAAYDGTLEKFIGDAVMGIFGLPHAHGDDPARALSASLELRDRVRADASLSDLKLRFGVCTGEVVASREVGADFLVTGDAVNVAARLQQAAEPWTILASDRTLAAVTAAYEMGPPIEIYAKGKSSAIRAREVRSKLAGSGGIRTSKAAMRGRQDELDQLALMARRAFKDKRPAFVTIIAPAGTGKTRLLEEFMARELPVIAPKTLAAIAQCLPYGNQLTYWPLRQVLFRLVGLEDEAGATDIRDRVAAWLDNPRYADLLATSIGYGVGEAPDRADVFAAWRYALERASNRQPLVLVFEDLHWSSESLLDLVDFVMQARGDAPILMLALARPELLDRRTSWGGGRRNFSNLFLEPLSDDEMRGLVRDLLEGSKEETVDAVVARAGGNPFYAEELVRSLRAGGSAEALPDTVQASIQARLDLLPAEERRVLQLGSIFGRTFRITGVIALSPELESRIDSLTESLFRRDVVRRIDQDHLSFGHVLIRDVAYQGLTRAERARLHASTGAWLESRAKGRESAVAELVAFHYRESIALLGRHRPVDFDEREIKKRAVSWLSRAGEAAAAAGANLEAARYIRAAIDLASDDDLPELYERLGDVEQLSRRSIDAYGTALELGRQARRPAVDELRVLGGLLMCSMRWAEGTGRFPIADIDRMLNEGRALTIQTDDARSLARFLAVESFYPWHRRREVGDVTPEMVARCEASGRRAVQLAESIRDWNTWSAAVDGVTSGLMERHDWAAARDLEQLRIDRQNDLSVLERMDAYHMVGQSSILMGDLVGAERVYRESAVLLDYAQNPSLILGLLGEHMLVLLLLGHWDQVVELGDHSLRVWNETHEVIGPGRIGFVAGLEVSRARRDTTRAAQFKEALIRMAPKAATGPLLRAYAELDLAAMEREVVAALKFGFGRIDVVERLLSALNYRRHSTAEPSVAAVTRYAQREQIPLLEAQALRAGRDFAGAVRILADIGAAPEEARTRIELDMSLGVRPDPEAVTTLRRLGDIEYLEAHQLEP